MCKYFDIFIRKICSCWERCVYPSVMSKHHPPPFSRYCCSSRKKKSMEKNANLPSTIYIAMLLSRCHNRNFQQRGGPLAWCEFHHKIFSHFIFHLNSLCMKFLSHSMMYTMPRAVYLLIISAHTLQPDTRELRTIYSFWLSVNPITLMYTYVNVIKLIKKMIFFYEKSFMCE